MLPVDPLGPTGGVLLDRMPGEIRELLSDLWTDEESQRKFLSFPHPLLNDRTPYEAISDPDGLDAVKGILIKALYGLPV